MRSYSRGSPPFVCLLRRSSLFACCLIIPLIAFLSPLLSGESFSSAFRYVFFLVFLNYHFSSPKGMSLLRIQRFLFIEWFPILFFVQDLPPHHTSPPEPVAASSSTASIEIVPFFSFTLLSVDLAFPCFPSVRASQLLYVPPDRISSSCSFSIPFFQF